MTHPMQGVLGELSILCALLPNPPGWFGEQSFGIKIMPYPVVNALLWGIGVVDIMTAFS
jgi:hypothetical protein